MRLIIVIFAAFVQHSFAIKQIVWDSLQSGRRNLVPKLTDINAKTPEAVQVWSAGTAVRDTYTHLSSRTPWTRTRIASPFVCQGYARYGISGNKWFSAPMVADMNVTCASLAFRQYLWRNIELSTPSSCECRPMISLNARLRGSCLVTPDAGWPGPALVKCDQKGIPPLASIKYHPTSGQIRIAGKCLTAVSFSPSQLTNSSEMFQPWGVYLANCVNYQDLASRQSWDLPDGVGELLTNLNWVSKDGLGSPNGRVGRIVLRGSSDIGERCLDVAITPMQIPTTYPVAFLEAILCGDARLTPGDFGMWSFYTNTPTTSTSSSSKLPSVPSTDGGYPSWQTCTDNTCSVCSKDDEYRGVWQTLLPGDKAPRTPPVSLPSGFKWKSTCNADALREASIPDALASLASACFCQEQPVLVHFNNNLTDNTPKLTNIIWSGLDDLPLNATEVNLTSSGTR